jgi:hypothetical protein
MARTSDGWPKFMKTFDFYFTHPRRNLLILSPPQSQKTAGVLTPASLGHPGPVVSTSTSTKADVPRATGADKHSMNR